MNNRGYVFTYGPMGSGKTLELIKRRYNYVSQNKKVLVAKHSSDLKAAHKITTRVKGIDDIPADVLIGPDDEPYDKILWNIGVTSLKSTGISCTFIDEVQFLSSEQVDNIYDKIVNNENIEVQAFGLKSDFIGVLFPGSEQSFKRADMLRELDVICPCNDNNSAEYNTRYDNGVAVFEGSQISIDGIDSTYKALCTSCYSSELLGAYHEGRPISHKLKTFLNSVLEASGVVTTTDKISV